MLGPKARPAPPVAERRPNKRRARTLLGGIVSHLDGSRSFNCVIRDLSEEGARIAFLKNQYFPSKIYLINVRDRLAYDAEVVWNNGAQAGLKFKMVHRLPNHNGPALSHLSRLCLSREGR